MNPVQGVYAVPTTPFTTDGSQNLAGLGEGVTRVFDAGVQGILALGATGEALSLSDTEREANVRAVVEAAEGRGGVVVGAMAYAPDAVTGLIRDAQRWGADAVMVTPAFYGGLPPEAAITALSSVMDKAELPVMVYNNPHSTGVDLLPEHLAQLNEHQSFWSVKETSGAATRVRELRSVLRDDVDVMIGADGIALEGFVQGATGWVAASAWLLPEACAQLWKLTSSGQWGEAVALWRRLGEPLGQIESNPAFISLLKDTLSALGNAQGAVRPPLPSAAAGEVKTLLESIDSLRSAHV